MKITFKQFAKDYNDGEEIVNKVLTFDKTLKYSLIRCQYKGNKAEFINDILSVLKELNGIQELLKYYKDYINMQLTEIQKAKLNVLIQALESNIN